LVYSDIREYQPGDDVKHIHWKVTARTGKVYVKSYEEDRQLRVMLAVDASASLRAPFGDQLRYKALEFVSIIGALTQRGNDLVGAAIFAKDVIRFLPPKAGSSRVHQILSALSDRADQIKGTDLRVVLAHLQTYLRKPCIIFVVSDFFCPPFERELKELSVRHDVVLVQLAHSLNAIPSAGIVSFVDAESGDEVTIDTSSVAVRTSFQGLMANRRAALRTLARTHGADHIAIEASALSPLASLMRQRAKRIMR